MKDRLAQFLKKEGLTAVKFAEIMEVQPSSISHLLAGRNKPNFDFISRMLLRFPDLNPDWLINGMGAIYKSKPITPETSITDVTKPAITNVIGPDCENVSEGISYMDTNINTENQKFNFPGKGPDFEVTDVNVRHGASSVESANKSIVNLEKEISRVILFFSDGSFEEYRK